MVADDPLIYRQPPRPAARRVGQTAARLLVAIAAMLGIGGGRASAADDVVVEPAEPVSAIQTNVIESLTPAEARKLLRDFVPGAQIEVDTGAACITRPHCLHLNALTSLDAETAAVLAKYRRGIMLGGLTSLDADTARALTSQGTRPLHLFGLTTLDADTAAVLAASKGWDGTLPKLATLEPDVAAALAAFEGADLNLGGLTTISPETAAALAKSQAANLHLYGMKTLSAAAARALAEFGGDKSMLLLPRLTEFDADIVTALAESKGKVSLPVEALAERIGQGLPLTPATVRLLSASAGPGQEIAIPGVIALHSPEAVEIARALAATKATLSLPNLKRISPQALAMLVASPTASIVIPPRDVLEVTAGLDGSHDDVVSP